MGQNGHQQRFDGNGDQGQHQHPGPLLVQHRPIELHANGDEKQAQQHVMEGPNVIFDALLVIGLRNQHSGQESTHGQ